MPLIVLTARLSRDLHDPDLLNITRSGADRARKLGRPFPGAPFAPTWSILGPAIEARRVAAVSAPEEAARIEDRAWERYAPAFLEEMRRSYRRSRGAWDALLARPRVVLACTCANAEHCHRTLLARDVLQKLGAVFEGEARPC